MYSNPPQSVFIDVYLHTVCLCVLHMSVCVSYTCLSVSYTCLSLCPTRVCLCVLHICLCVLHVCLCVCMTGAIQYSLCKDQCGKTRLWFYCLERLSCFCCSIHTGCVICHECDLLLHVLCLILEFVVHIFVSHLTWKKYYNKDLFLYTCTLQLYKLFLTFLFSETLAFY